MSSSFPCCQSISAMRLLHILLAIQQYLHYINIEILTSVNYFKTVNMNFLLGELNFHHFVQVVVIYLLMHKHEDIDFNFC